MGFMVIRVLFVLTCAGMGYFLHPWGLGRPEGLVLGLAFSAGMIATEVKMRRLDTKVLLGGVAGVGIGLSLALGFGAITRTMVINADTSTFLQALYVVVLGYLGLVVGAKQGEWAVSGAVKAFFRDTPSVPHHKILDTSAIIDGRIFDITDSGFVDGTLIVPQFVLNELQQIADSDDPLRSNRGRRGLDVIRKLQKSPDVDVQISDLDFPDHSDVDAKLIELSKQLSGQLVTNDFNLNKVAQLRGIPVLNINELANALKPVVLPGETMTVSLIKEGKEAGQAVAYLDDGTMVVVDNSGHLIGETIDVVVTSVLQTTAGRMIFSKQQQEASASTHA
ncbi:MAG: TRAM domain-containing protein [Acidobacteria bacterium]|nr:TRAM domain-containing protein [Acidobacteriota bacterium]